VGGLGDSPHFGKQQRVVVDPQSYAREAAVGLPGEVFLEANEGNDRLLGILRSTFRFELG
jgi:hypothetical protein